MEPSCSLRTPLCRCQSNLRVFSPSTRVRRQTPPNTDSWALGIMDMAWYTGSRRMGALGCQLSEPLGPPARLVPGGLASGHGASVGGATTAPAEPARSGQPMGFPWVCTVCSCGGGSCSPCGILGSTSLVHSSATWALVCTGQPLSISPLCLRRCSPLCNPQSCAPAPEALPSLVSLGCTGGCPPLSLAGSASPFPILTSLLTLFNTLARIHKGLCGQVSEPWAPG